MALFTINDAADLVDKAIQYIFLKDDVVKDKLYDKYFNVVTGVTDYYTKDSSLSGLKYVGRRVENATSVVLAPVQGLNSS